MVLQVSSIGCRPPGAEEVGPQAKEFRYRHVRGEHGAMSSVLPFYYQDSRNRVPIDRLHVDLLSTLYSLVLESCLNLNLDRIFYSRFKTRTLLVIPSGTNSPTPLFLFQYVKILRMSFCMWLSGFLKRERQCDLSSRQGEGRSRSTVVFNNIGCLSAMWQAIAAVPLAS